MKNSVRHLDENCLPYSDTESLYSSKNASLPDPDTTATKSKYLGQAAAQGTTGNPTNAKTHSSKHASLPQPDTLAANFSKHKEI